MLLGLVGRTILKVLEERNLQISEYAFFSSSKSAGTVLSFMGKNYTVRELTKEVIYEQFDFAIFSAGADTSKRFAPLFASIGTVVIDNSSCFRMDANVPLVVPEINFDTITKDTKIIANPNCSTIQAVLPLKPLDDAYKIKRIVYSTYQAVSGAGRYGLEDLENTSMHSPLKKFPHQIYNNCLPHIDSFLNNGYTKEEEKMINETRKILNRPNLKVTATTVRVPVENCHSEAINVEFEKNFDLDELRIFIGSLENVILQDDIQNNIYPMPILANGHDEVFVGRIRRDYSVENGINMWIVADNIRKGAATNAVQILEKMLLLP